jgi:tetraacyldisaccharide 4'-kinase
MSAAGDEAPLLAAVAPTIVASDRAAGARRADADGADVIIMDDGFQNFALAKDLSILVVDGETGFGNGRLIPAGPLRERVSDGLARADAVVCMGDGILPIPRRFLGPSLRARLLPKSESLNGRPVLAFAGIGKPEKFFRTLHEMDAVLRGQRTFADHHTYSAAELKSLRAEAANLGAALVTTEKDWTRIPSEERAGILAVPVEAIFENPAAAVSLLDRLWPKPEEPRR